MILKLNMTERHDETMKEQHLSKNPPLKGSYDAISSFAFSLECYKLILHR